MRRFMIICALLGACIIAFAAQQSKADQPQKPAQQPKVDFTVNYAVESNYNTADLRKQLFDKKDTTVMVVSHRGDWHGTAENSLHAIQKAIEKGCAAVAVDVRKTRDDSLVLMADETVDRMTNGKGRVADLTLAEVRALTLKEYHGNPTPLRIPTLEEALRFCKGKILITVSNYNDYKKDIDALVKQTDTGTEFFRLDKIPRKTAATWKMAIEHEQVPHDSVYAVYGRLRAKGVTVFVTDAPKAFNGFLNISHVMASKSVSRVYGDGQKVDYILVRYDHAIDGATVNKNTYEVENHVVADAFTSSTETPDGRADQGNNVIIVLKNTLYLDNTNTSAKSATTTTDAAKTGTRDEQQHAIPTIAAGSKPERKNNPYPTTVVFRQTAPVKTTDGKTYTERLLLRNTMAAHWSSTISNRRSTMTVRRATHCATTSLYRRRKPTLRGNIRWSSSCTMPAAPVRKTPTRCVRASAPWSGRRPRNRPSTRVSSWRRSLTRWWWTTIIIRQAPWSRRRISSGTSSHAIL